MKTAIVTALKNTFSGTPWYGESFWSVIASLEYHDLNKTTPSGKSIGHVLNHILAWRTYALEQLSGNKDYYLEVGSIQDWDITKNFDSDSCHILLTAIKNNQEKLIQAISSLPEQHLKHKVPGKKYTFYDLILGIRDHDIYHLGQISLIKNNL